MRASPEEEASTPPPGVPFRSGRDDDAYASDSETCPRAGRWCGEGQTRLSRGRGDGGVVPEDSGARGQADVAATAAPDRLMEALSQEDPRDAA
ncbi:hypothetical protein MPTA5024_22825 [Microbispora sp. ATCC PTA-5024]|nr:hypothetical protein MPTA5024_22825 [Microbispora sp. ATCC PTA-5024]